MLPADTTNTGDDASRGDLLFAVEIKCGQLWKLQKWWTRIKQPVNAVASNKFS